jgi:hypothetical protein
MPSLSVARVWRVVLAFGLAAVGLIGSGAARASAATCQITPTPSLGSGSSQLSGVATTSSTNAWAVGDGPSGPVIEHWNGRAWVVQPTPNVPHSGLSGVASTSSTNAWAVGAHGVNVYLEKTLIEHWNGKVWKVQASLSVPWSHLSGVVATSSTNAWAVGGYTHGRGKLRVFHTLIEHWNGKAWTVQPSPTPNYLLWGGGFVGVAATSSRNAWAVGTYGDAHYNLKTLIEHWDGKVWKVQKSPTTKFEGETNALTISGVAATSPRNAWVVGYNAIYGSDFADTRTVIEHWNGAAWKLQKGPNQNTDIGLNQLSGVAATSPRNAWVVGTPINGSMIQHWNGSAWTIQPSPNPGSTLTGVAATSPTNIWAVGNYFNGTAKENQTLALHCS